MTNTSRFMGIDIKLKNINHVCQDIDTQIYNHVNIEIGNIKFGNRVNPVTLTQ